MLDLHAQNAFALVNFGVNDWLLAYADFMF